MAAQPRGLINATHCTPDNGLCAKFCYACYCNLKKKIFIPVRNTHTHVTIFLEIAGENAECKTWLALFTVPKLISSLQLWEFTAINTQGAEISNSLSLSSLLPRSSHQSAI